MRELTSNKPYDWLFGSLELYFPMADITAGFAPSSSAPQVKRLIASTV